LWLAKTAVWTEEAFAIGVESMHVCVHVIEGKMVAPLAVLRLVIDGAPVYLDLAGAPIPLVVCRVVIRVPQTELDEREQLDRAGGLCFVPERHLVDLRGVAERDEIDNFRRQAISLAGDLRVAEAMAALEEVELPFDGHEGRRPDLARVVNVEVATAGI